jgi:hypothetical protein
MAASTAAALLALAAALSAAPLATATTTTSLTFLDLLRVRAPAGEPDTLETRLRFGRRVHVSVFLPSSAATPAPLVALAHPAGQRMDELAALLAQDGLAVVTVAAARARGARESARDLLLALRELAVENAEPSSLLVGRLNLTRIGLLGFDEGADAVLLSHVVAASDGNYSLPAGASLGAAALLAPSLHAPDAALGLSLAPASTALLIIAATADCRRSALGAALPLFAKALHAQCRTYVELSSGWSCLFVDAGASFAACRELDSECRSAAHVAAISQSFQQSSLARPLLSGLLRRFAGGDAAAWPAFRGSLQSLAAAGHLRFFQSCELGGTLFTH